MESFMKVQEYNNWKSVENARMAFKVRTNMVPKIKKNFRKKYGGDVVCDHCHSGEEESQDHAMLCVAWERHREGLDLYKLEDMVEYFKRILIEKDSEAND